MAVELGSVAALYSAAEAGHVPAVEALVDMEVDVNEGTGGDNATPLYIASLMGHDNVVMEMRWQSPQEKNDHNAVG